MTKCFIGLVVALVTATSAFAVVHRTAAQIPNSPVAVHSQGFDGCPYYPSPATCKVHLAAQ